MRKGVSSFVNSHTFRPFRSFCAIVSLFNGMCGSPGDVGEATVGLENEL